MTSLGVSEIQSIAETPLGLINLNPLFIDDAREPFHTFCGILTLGKEMSNPNIKRKRDALMLMFDDFARAKKTPQKFSNKKSSSRTRLSYLEMADGFRRLGKKWAFYSSDELATLAVMIDLENKGYFGFDDFFNFAFIVTESLRQETADPTKCFNVLYECLRDRLLKRIEETRKSGEYLIDTALEEKLVTIVGHARRRGLMPLTHILSYIGEHGSTGLNADLLSNLFEDFGVLLDAGGGNQHADADPQSRSANNSFLVEDLGERVGTEYDGTPPPAAAEEDGIAAAGVKLAGADGADDNGAPESPNKNIVKSLRDNMREIHAKLSNQQYALDTSLGNWSEIQAQSPVKSPAQSPGKSQGKIVAGDDGDIVGEGYVSNFGLSPVPVRTASSRGGEDAAVAVVTVGGDDKISVSSSSAKKGGSIRKPPATAAAAGTIAEGRISAAGAGKTRPPQSASGLAVAVAAPGAAAAVPHHPQQGQAAHDKRAAVAEAALRAATMDIIDRGSHLGDDPSAGRWAQLAHAGISGSGGRSHSNNSNNNSPSQDERGELVPPVYDDYDQYQQQQGGGQGRNNTTTGTHDQFDAYYNSDGGAEGDSSYDLNSSRSFAAAAAYHTSNTDNRQQQQQQQQQRPHSAQRTNTRGGGGGGGRGSAVANDRSVLVSSAARPSSVSRIHSHTHSPSVNAAGVRTHAHTHANTTPASVILRTAETSRMHSVSLASKYADLSIFRSPGTRQVHGNKNKFDTDKLGWKPTRLTGGRNERFQSTADLVVQAKFNQIMTPSIAAQSQW